MNEIAEMNPKTAESAVKPTAPSPRNGDVRLRPHWRTGLNVTRVAFVVENICSEA